MKQIEFENLSKNELFEKIKAEYAQKAKHNFVQGIIYGLLCLATIIADFYLTKSSLILWVIIFLMMFLLHVLLSLKAKNMMKSENAEELLSRYDANTNKITNIIQKWIPFFPFIGVPVLLFIGYVIYDMIATINIERFGVVLFWLIIAFLVLCFIIIIFLLMFIIAIIKGNDKKIGWKDEPTIARLRELVEKEKQVTL